MSSRPFPRPRATGTRIALNVEIARIEASSFAVLTGEGLVRTTEKIISELAGVGDRRRLLRRPEEELGPAEVDGEQAEENRADPEVQEPAARERRAVEQEQRADEPARRHVPGGLRAATPGSREEKQDQDALPDDE